jgi:acetoin:2,6-dichlorophenolindophenol oxidoreductase subunit alpha
MPAKWKAEALSAPLSTNENSLISSEKLKQLYTTMLRLRMLNERLHGGFAAYRKDSHFEACEAACTVDLRKEDLIATLPNQHVGYLAREVKLADVLRRRTQRRRGHSIDCTQGLALSLNILDAQGSGLSLATGASFAYKTAQHGRVVIAFCLPEEIARSQDSIYYAMQHGLPILYVQMGERSVKSRKTRQRLSYPSIAAIPVDQNDVVAIYRVAAEGIDKARRGVGPTLIQCVRYDSPSMKKRPAATLSSDPIVYIEQYLRKKNLWSDQLKDAIHEDFSRELNEALQAPHRVT